MGNEWMQKLPLKKRAYIQLIAALHGVSLSDLYKPEWCAKCGGLCCKKAACGVAPFDVEGPITVENIRKLLKSGKYMITVDFIYHGQQGDRHYGFPQSIQAVPYLSIREEGAGEIHISPLHSKCAMLGSHGCTLPLNERGTNGFLLKPGPKVEQCYNLTRQPSELWMPYQAIFEEIVQKEKGMSIQSLSECEWIRVKKIMNEKIRNEVVPKGIVSRQDWEIMNTLIAYGEIHPWYALPLLMSKQVYP